MHETFIVTVQIADGRCLIQEKITGSLQDLSLLLSQLSHVFTSVSKDSSKLETLLGRGTGQFVQDSSLPMES